MSDSDLGFCPRCGAKVSQGTVYCPECGENLSGDVVIDGPIVRMSDSARSEGLMIWILFLLGAYAAMSIIGGAVSIFAPDGIINYMKGTLGESGWTAYLSSIGLDESGFRSMTVYTGSINLVSGILAFVSLALCSVRRYWSISMIFCGTSAAVLFADMFFVPSTQLISDLIETLIEVAIGGMVTYYIYQCKSVFK
jgi:uncharacterized membrane protein (UPF0136 family)